MKQLLLAAAVLASTTTPVIAGETHFSLSGGFPFFIIPEISYHPNDEQRWFLNGKVGLDEGISAGFEHAVSNNNRHALGLFAGALGIRNGHRLVCEEENASGSVGESFACEFGYALVSAFDNHTVNGLGASYSYNGNGLNDRGLRFRVEFGYGRISDADFDKDGFTGGVAIGYQF